MNLEDAPFRPPAAKIRRQDNSRGNGREAQIDENAYTSNSETPAYAVEIPRKRIIVVFHNTILMLVTLGVVMISLSMRLSAIILLGSKFVRVDFDIYVGAAVMTPWYHGSLTFDRENGSVYFYLLEKMYE